MVRFEFGFADLRPLVSISPEQRHHPTQKDPRGSMVRFEPDSQTTTLMVGPDVMLAGLVVGIHVPSMAWRMPFHCRPRQLTPGG